MGDLGGRVRAVTGALVALTLLGTGLVGCSSGEPLVKPDFSKARVKVDRGVTDADFDAVQRVLDRRAKALLRGDKRAFLATVDPTDARLRRRQSAVFDNLQELPVSKVYYGVGRSGLVPDKVRGRALTLRPEIVEHVQLTGVNSRPVSNEVTMTFVRRGGRWLLGKEREDPSFEAQARPWYGGRIESAGDRRLLVLTDADAEVGADELLGTVRAALAAVTDVLDQEPRLPLLLDATTNGRAYELSNASGEDAGAVFFSTFASDRLGEDYTARAGAIVKANPDAVAQLVEDARTLRHELTHYVLDHSDDSAPQWATEGIAEWVGYQPGLLADSYITDKSLERKIDRRRVELTPPGRWGDDPEMDYLTAEAFTEFLITREGLSRYLDMMAEFRREERQRGNVYGEGTLDDVLKKVYDLTPREVAKGGFALLQGL